MDAVKQLLRGEPAVTRGVALAVLVVAYAAITGSWDKETIGAILLPVLQAFITRPATTPAVNPAPPTTIAVKPNDGEDPADLPPMSLPPIRTITGAQR